MNTEYNRDIMEGDSNLWHRHFKQFSEKGSLDNAKQILQCSYLIPAGEFGQKWHVSIKVGQDVLSFRCESPVTLRRFMLALGVIWSGMYDYIKKETPDEFNLIAEAFIRDVRVAIEQMRVEE